MERAHEKNDVVWGSDVTAMKLSLVLGEEVKRKEENVFRRV